MSISPHPLLGIGTRIRQSLLAQDCILCQAASGDRLVCAACERDLASPEHACPRCALPDSGDVECGACLAGPPHYEATRAVFTYTYPVDVLVQALKYGGQLALAAWFAQKLQQRIFPADAVDLIVPLPLYPIRLAERGFNQAAEVAKALSRASGLRMDTQLARRVRNTVPQTNLPWREREANMRQAFSCERDLSGLSVAVIDDVMTTGSTLNEFARTLKRSGAVRVQNWVIARTPAGV